MNIFKTMLDDESGATAVEYGLIAALVVIAMVASLSTMGGSTASMWNGMAQKVSNAGTG